MRTVIVVCLTVAACFAVTLIGLAVVAEPTGFPMLNFWYWQVMIYIVAGTVCRAVVSSDFADRLGVGIGNWYRAGGFWAVWSESNTPANTWVIIALVAFGNALTYGPPSPKVDWDRTKNWSMVTTNEALASPVAQKATKGVKDLTNYLVKGLIGREIIDSKVPVVLTVEKPVAKYYRGWSRIWLTFLITLFTGVVWVWSRRDDVSDKFHELAAKFKKRREEGKATSSDSGAGGGSSSGLVDLLISQTSRGNQVVDHIFGEALSRVGESIFGVLAKTLRR